MSDLGSKPPYSALCMNDCCAGLSRLLHMQHFQRKHLFAIPAISVSTVASRPGARETRGLSEWVVPETSIRLWPVEVHVGGQLQ
jgi:uncharacterized protein YjaG (DUF416 family)